MGQLIIPTDITIKGPWLLDKKSLEELHEGLTIIEQRLEEAFQIALDKSAHANLEEYRKWDKEIDIAKAKEKLLDSYRFSTSEKYILVQTTQGKKIKNESLLSLIKDSQIADYNPNALRIHIAKGPCEFTLEVSTKYDGDLDIRVNSVDDETFNDISYQIHKWIDNHKPSLVVQKWSSWFPMAFYPILFILLLITSELVKSKKEIYKSQLSQESSALLKDSLTEEEINKAVEIILKKESDYVPENFKPDIAVNQSLKNIWIWSLIAVAILIIRPKTVIGLGKNQWRVKFYKNWIYFVLVFIPISFAFPIIRSRF